MKKFGLFILYVLMPFLAYTDVSIHSAQAQTLPQASASDKNAAIDAIRDASLHGDYPSAEKLLADYVQKFGEDKQYLTEKARYLALSGNPQDALKLIGPLLQNDPQNQTLLDIKNYALAHQAPITPNSEFAEVSPEVSAAQQAVQMDNYPKAVTLYKQALSKNPNDRTALIGLAQTYLFMGNYKAGESTLAQYKNKYGADDQYLTETARDLAFNGHSQQALDVLEPLLAKDPTNDVLLDIKQYASIRLPGRSARIAPTVVVKPGAISAAQKAAVYASQSKKAKDYAIASNEYLDAGDMKNALIMINDALQLDPNNADYITQREIINGRIEEQVTSSQPIPSVATQPLTAVSAADQAVGSGNYKKAVTLYKQALSKNPNDKDALIGLARAYLFMENYKAGESTLALYKKKFGADDQYLTERARDLAFTGHSRQSLDVLAPLLKKDPNDSDLLGIKKYATNRLYSNGGTGSSYVVAKKAAAAAGLQGKNAHAYARAAKAYLDAGDAKQALVMIRIALFLDPNNSNYLQMQADIANNLDDQAIVYKSYKQLYKTDRSPKILLGLARAANRLGKLDESMRLYALYTRTVPNDKTAWLEYAYVQSWRGNDRNAIWVLNQYHKRFGDDNVYLAERARILSSAARYKESFVIVNRMLPRMPKNYDLNFANTTDYYYSNQPVKMFQSFPRVKAIEPDSDETKGLWAFIRTPYRSNMGMDIYDSFDTDTVKITHVQLLGQYYLSPVTSLLANIEDERLSASITSGLSPVEGGHALYLYGYNFGINHRFNSILAMQAFIGGQDASDGEKSVNYEADAFINPLETVGVNLQVKRAFYDQSPLSVSRGVKQDLAQAGVAWQPCLQCFLNLNAAYATFTDNNTMRWFEVSPSTQIVSSQRFNVIVGLDAQFYKFGRVLADGYYSPTNYKYGAFTTSIYYKYNDNIGAQLSLGLGTQHDETFIAWRPADDLSLKGFYGIYQDWYVVLSGGLSTRGRSIATNESLGTYRVYAFDLAITRRFG